MASARLFLKSDKATRPTVCVLNRSSAVFRWLVNLRFDAGAEEPEAGSEAMI